MNKEILGIIHTNRKNGNLNSNDAMLLENYILNLESQSKKEINKLGHSELSYIIAIQKIKNNLINESLKINELVKICDEALKNAN